MEVILNYFHINFQENSSLKSKDLVWHFKFFTEKFIEHEEEIFEFFDVKDRGELRSVKQELKYFVTE